MKNILFILLIGTILLVSCSSTKPKGFVYQFEDGYTGLDTLINIEGYYYFKTSCEDRSTLQQMIMFYPNGLLLTANVDIPREFSFCFESNDKVDKCEYPSWGTYKIYGDTIKTQTIQNYGSLYGTLLFYQDYKILSDHEIISMARYCDSKRDKGCNGYKENPCPTIAKFQQLKSKRDYNACPWLKKKWFNVKE